jgi:hypothetical protein
VPGILTENEIDVSKISDQIFHAEDIIEETIENSNLIKLTLLAQYFLVHLDPEEIKNQPYSIVMNKIMIQYYEMLESHRNIVDKGARNKFRKIQKRPYNLLNIMIFDRLGLLNEQLRKEIEKKATASSNYAASKKMLTKQISGIQTDSTSFETFFENLIKLLTGTLDNEKYVSKMRISSFNDVLAANNNNLKRGNLLNHHLENFKGDSDGQKLIDQYVEKVKETTEKKKPPQGVGGTSFLGFCVYPSLRLFSYFC